jgi:hypothetical protein
MSPLHINMTNVFHTGRPRGSLTTATSVTNSARPVSASLSDLYTRLKRILSKYAGFVGPGILISIAYMVRFRPRGECCSLEFRIRGIILQTFPRAHNSSTNFFASSSCPTSSLVFSKRWHVNSEVSRVKTLLRIVENISHDGFAGVCTLSPNWQSSVPTWQKSSAAQSP